MDGLIASNWLNPISRAMDVLMSVFQCRRKAAVAAVQRAGSEVRLRTVQIWLPHHAVHSVAWIPSQPWSSVSSSVKWITVRFQCRNPPKGSAHNISVVIVTHAFVVDVFSFRIFTSCAFPFIHIFYVPKPSKSRLDSFITSLHYISLRIRFILFNLWTSDLCVFSSLSLFTRDVDALYLISACLVATFTF